jgi:methanogenic corrinoid protein MtbC1
MLNVYEELSETSRRQILAELRGGARCVNELVLATGLKQPNVSNHLARMRCRGIVHASKIGRQVYYSLASPEVEEIIRSVFSEPCSDHCQCDLSTLAKLFAKAAINGDETCCSAMLDKAIQANLTLLDVYDQLLKPAMDVVGQWYLAGIVDEGHEHMASAITERMLCRTVQLAGAVQRMSPGVALLGCPPHAYHVIGLRMACDFLKASGWTTRYLGANVPIPAFVGAVEDHMPDIVLTSLTTDEDLPDTLALLRALRDLKAPHPHITIGVGGMAVCSHRPALLAAGADFASDSLRSFADETFPRLNSQSR